MKTNTLIFFVILLSYGTSSSFALTCSTITNAISNITDCVGGTCTVHYSTLITADLSDGYSSCINFAAIKEGNTTLLPQTNFNLTIVQAGHDIPLELQYVTGEPAIIFDSYCDCDLLVPTNDCDDMGFEIAPKLSVCRLSSQYIRNCFIHTVYSYAQKIGIDIDPRYKVFLARNPTLEVNLHYDYDDLSGGVVWNAMTPTHVPISAEIGFDLLSSSHESAPNIPKYLALDMLVPYDLYDATTFNMAGEYSSSKPGSIYWLPDGTFKSKIENFADKWQAVLHKCAKEHTFSTLELNVPRVDDILENFRLSNTSVRNSYPNVLYFDYNTYYESNFWTHTTINPSHIISTKQTGTTSTMNNYILALNANGFLTQVGNINTICYFGDLQTPVNSQFTIMNCDGSLKIIKCDGSSGWSWYKAESSAWVTTYGTYMDWQGNCRNTTFGQFPAFVPINDDSHALFIPFTTVGSFDYRVYGKLPGISFTTQLCPDILSAKDDPVNHAINLTARSTCGSGNALIMSNDSLSHSSNLISLTGQYSVTYIPRNANMSGVVSIGICSFENCKYINVKLGYFPYVAPVDDNGDNGVPNPNQNDDEDDKKEPSFFGSWSDFWSNVADAFHWKFTSWRSIIFKVFTLLIVAALIVAGIFLSYFLLKKIISYCLMKKKATKLHTL